MVQVLYQKNLESALAAGLLPPPAHPHPIQPGHNHLEESAAPTKTKTFRSIKPKRGMYTFILTSRELFFVILSSFDCYNRNANANAVQKKIHSINQKCNILSLL
jgi:hypothetical protein